MRTQMLIVMLLPLAIAAGCGQNRTVSFQTDVAPLLEKSCAECHTGDGEGLKKSGLGMDSYEALMKGTKFGPVIVPGNSASSTLARLLQGKASPEINMPHHRDPLPDAEVNVIVQWIDQGAKNN
jgi:Planctomycete cytochrome C